ncbi:glycosyltransferase [Mucilaginibacter terrenus]|uniref:Glycosyltransferase n=1 Tax=Mucilaginibacter terrenus TaxID=2482727 RepID=A0A3E2NW24_9SPHI|nr:glycosyltransferase family 4 protein [Mucilaginibacter terrenus]RFZ85214.1 glycosyltransferase [Mucilaginibacter terrenus]
MKKLLLITDVDFWNGGAGHRVRIGALVSYLGDNTELYIAYIGIVSPMETPRIAELKATVIILDNEDILSPMKYGEKLAEKTKDIRLDAVIIEYIHLSYMLNFVNEDVTMLLDMHDIVSDRTEAFHKFNYGGIIHEMSAEDEFGIMDVYDHVMVLCEPDRKKLYDIIPGKVILCPHPNLVHRRLVRPKVNTITYIASEYLPNVDAIIHFMETAWPLVSAEKNIELHIYGNVCHPLMGRELPARVFLKGYAADINKVYDNADIIINPVRFGAGMKIKTLEALASTVPLVTTAHGARGLEQLAGKGLIIVDNTEDFAFEIQRLINDCLIRQRLVAEAGDFIEQNYGPEKCFAPLSDAIQL